MNFDGIFSLTVKFFCRENERKLSCFFNFFIIIPLFRFVLFSWSFISHCFFGHDYSKRLYLHPNRRFNSSLNHSILQAEIKVTGSSGRSMAIDEMFFFFSQKFNENLLDEIFVSFFRPSGPNDFSLHWNGIVVPTLQNHLCVPEQGILLGMLLRGPEYSDISGSIWVMLDNRVTSSMFYTTLKKSWKKASATTRHHVTFGLNFVSSIPSLREYLTGWPRGSRNYFSLNLKHGQPAFPFMFYFLMHNAYIC